jgi:AraC-like DNA-binding protein
MLTTALRRAPRPSLRPFIREVWISGRDEASGATRELSLPGVDFHLVLRLSDDPVLIYDGIGATTTRLLGHAVIGGARSAPFVRDIAAPAISIGAQLQPGAARLLFGVPANELAEHHTRLGDVWGPAADEARTRILEAQTPEGRLDQLEAILAARLPRVRALHPAIANALEHCDATPRIDALVDASGYSHRRFIALFREAVGLTPKRYARVRRFQAALARLESEPQARWADLAMDLGYSDQAHFAREFREFSGLTPQEYRRAAPCSPYHVPQVNFLQDLRQRRR